MLLLPLPLSKLCYHCFCALLEIYEYIIYCIFYAFLCTYLAITTCHSLQWCHNERDDVSNHQPLKCSGADQRKSPSSQSLAFVGGIHWGLVDSPHKGPVMWKIFPFDDVTSCFHCHWDIGVLQLCYWCFMIVPLKFENGWVMSYHTVLDMWLFIHAEIHQDIMKHVIGWAR